MPRLLICILLTLLVTSCGRSKPQAASPSALEQLDERLAVAASWAPLCTFDRVEKAPSKASCDNGDGLLWNGILCSQNPKRYAQSCLYVKESQDEDGRMWRGPHRVGENKPNSFSRDMAVGFLLYVQATRDFEALEHWVAFVVSHEGRMCGVGTTPEDYATDNRCDSMAGIRGLAKLIHKKVDWGKDLQVFGADTILLGLYTTTKGGELGYPQHLAAQQLDLLRKLGYGHRYYWTKSAENLQTRNPRNAFFAYLNEDYDLAVNLMLQQIPQKKPTNQNQWSFERADSEEAWKQSMIWEFLWLRSKIP